MVTRDPTQAGWELIAIPRILTESQRREIDKKIIEPTLEHMRASVEPFTGFLYAGLMMTGQWSQGAGV